MHQPACFSSSRHTSTTVVLSKFPKGFLCCHRPTLSHMYTKRMQIRARIHTNTQSHTHTTHCSVNKTLSVWNLRCASCRYVTAFSNVL